MKPLFSSLQGEGLQPKVQDPSKTASSTRTRDYCRNIAGLGLQAAEALDHAHTRGILHRDIKPANLLLDAEGRIWVTDFGLAQIQGNHGLTLTGDILGTLRYMSPEQALAKRVVIDGRTDVYSLGVTLYELLTLQPAFDGKDRAEILRKIADDEPAPLRKLNASVPQDLETIIHKALAKEPSARYASAKELADDLRNYMEARPIQARRPSLQDRAAKWARRHTTSVASASVILVLAMIGFAMSTVLVAREQRRTAAALARADARFQFARKAVDEMYTQFAEKWIAQQPRLTSIQHEFLEKALKFYGAFADARSEDPEVRMDAALARYRVALIQDKLGMIEGARTSYRQAVAEFKVSMARFPRDAAHRAECAKLLWSAEFNYSMYAAGPEGEQILKHLLDVSEKRLTENPADLDDRRSVAAVLINLANQAGDSQTKLKHQSRAIEILEKLVVEFPDRRDFRSKLVHAQTNAVALSDLGRSDEAEGVLRSALASAEILVADPSEAPNSFESLSRQGKLAMALGLLARTLLKSGRTSEADQPLGRALAIMEKLSDYPDLSNELCWEYSLLSEWYMHARGAAFFDPRRVLEVARRIAQQAPDNHFSWKHLGLAEYLNGHWDEAIQAVEKWQTLPGGTYCYGEFLLALAYARKGDFAIAQNWYNTATAHLNRQPGQSIEHVLDSFESEAELLRILPHQREVKSKPAPEPVRPPK